MLFTLAVAVLSATGEQGASKSRFNCTVGPAPPPTDDISKLHPSHIKYVMAMGDSITAAFAARSSPLEARDLSWSIGVGNINQLTFPYLVQSYTNKTVMGASTQAVLPKDIIHLPHNDYHFKTDNMNVAESEGAVHRGSMQEQWGFLMEQMKLYPEFNEDWKVLTIWMFANDVCGECGPNDPSPAFLDAWTKGYNDLLTNVTSTMKKVYVNVIATLDLSNIARLQRSNEFCKIEHEHLLKECGCIDRGNSTELKKLDETVHIFNQRLHNISAAWYEKIRTMGREKDVAVVTQSFMEGIGKNLDISFLNDLDCFHPSAKAHQDLAIGLWNSMLCTDDRKNRCNMSFTPDLPVLCPTNTSVFYTGPDIIPNPPTL